jgi:hypothetical protein
LNDLDTERARAGVVRVVVQHPLNPGFKPLRDVGFGSQRIWRHDDKNEQKYR